MSQSQINEMLKKMLDFGGQNSYQNIDAIDVPPVSTPSTTNDEKKDETDDEKKDETNETKEVTEKTPLLSRKQRRENQRKEERILKAKNKKNPVDEKPTLIQIKEKIRKNAFEKEDKTRIERILFNK
jgi:hypothetical protein